MISLISPYLDSHSFFSQPDAPSCVYGGVSSKPKVQESPKTRGYLLLEPKIPLMNETAHHNIHVLSKLLAK